MLWAASFPWLCIVAVVLAAGFFVAVQARAQTF
jgi:hypothetical protein